jgi:hypothetical protein
LGTNPFNVESTEPSTGEQTKKTREHPDIMHTGWKRRGSMYRLAEKKNSVLNRTANISVPERHSSLQNITIVECIKIAW